MITLILGGSGSGKSEFAENLARTSAGKKYYIATMAVRDDESSKKVQHHRKMRCGKNFKTIEAETNIAQVCVDGGTVLLECMSNLVANEVFGPLGAMENAYDSIIQGIDALAEKAENLIVVSNEIFSDGLTYDEATIQYILLLGKINCYLTQIANEVIEVVYGIPIYHKRGEKEKCLHPYL